MKDDDKVKSISEYQLKKQLKGEQYYLLELSEVTDLKQNHNEVTEIEKKRIQSTIEKMSQFCGWVLSDYVVMRNGIKLVFIHQDCTEKKELMIHTDEQNQFIVTTPTE